MLEARVWMVVWLKYIFFTCVLSGGLIVYMTHMHRIAAATATL